MLNVFLVPCRFHLYPFFSQTVFVLAEPELSCYKIPEILLDFKEFKEKAVQTNRTPVNLLIALFDYRKILRTDPVQATGNVCIVDELTRSWWRARCRGLVLMFWS